MTGSTRHSGALLPGPSPPLIAYEDAGTHFLLPRHKLQHLLGIYCITDTDRIEIRNDLQRWRERRKALPLVGQKKQETANITGLEGKGEPTLVQSRSADTPAEEGGGGHSHTEPGPPQRGLHSLCWPPQRKPRPRKAGPDSACLIITRKALVCGYRLRRTKGP
ncbi:hypothetical protein MHYP_G00035250 [Metynnis hypsauchen]